MGYVDTTLPPTAPDADSHIGCFQGYLPEAYGGAENSLTLWRDQGGPEILCDYGAAYSFMMYLYSHYGEDFMSQLHTEPGNGLKGLTAVLRTPAPAHRAPDGPRLAGDDGARRGDRQERQAHRWLQEAVHLGLAPAPHDQLGEPAVVRLPGARRTALTTSASASPATG